jgi:alpha-D-ribose 1-methylphosphonate 5-triphosphate synthase subunit PhnG
MAARPATLDDSAARRRWLSILARAPLDALEARWAYLDLAPAYAFLRAPETGLAMVRARAGGTGAKFNLGEMTVTRCAVRLDDGATGVGYVAGRSARHATLVALIDALLLRESRRDAVLGAIVEPLAALLDERARAQRADAARTKVDFFTLVRGD